MAAVNRYPDGTPIHEGEIVSSSPVIRYPGVPSPQLPEKPATEIRRSGFLGLGTNRQDVANERRLVELYHLGIEVAYAEVMAAAVEVKGIQAVGDKMAQAESIVYSHPAETVAGMVTADLTGEMAARSRLRHSRLMETYDAEAINLLQRRR